MSTQLKDGRNLRLLGGFGCLTAVLAGGVAVVLSVLGVRAASREALPFGLVLLALAPFVAVIGAAALSAGLRRRGFESEAGAPELAARPPAVLACTACGSPMALCISNPSRTHCAHCHTERPVPESIAGALQRAAQHVAEKDASERQISGVTALASSRRRLWMLTLLLLSVGLTAIGLICAWYGYVSRLGDEDWIGWVAFGVASALIVPPLSIAGGLVLGAVTANAARRWTALTFPEGGLGCRVCGGPLPTKVAAVLRCDYCAADNLAGSDVLRRVADSVGHAQRELFGATTRKRSTEEAASITLVSFPAFVLLVWFGLGAFSGTAVLSLADHVELAADPDARFVLVRASLNDASPPMACFAAIDDGRVHLGGGPGNSRSLSSDELGQMRLGPAVGPEWLVGRRVTGVGIHTATHQVLSVYRPLRWLRAHDLRLAGSESSRRLPGSNGWGNTVCLPDVPVAPGRSLRISK